MPNDLRIVGASQVPTAMQARLYALHGRVLRGDPAHTFRDRLGSRVFVAVIGDRVVGFKVGQEKHPGVFHSRMGAVCPDHRRQGIARALIVAQHSWAREAGYTHIHTETLNVFRAMLLLNLDAGFTVVGTRTLRTHEPQLLLEKDLRDEVRDAPSPRGEPVDVTYRIAPLPLDEATRAGVAAVHEESFASPPQGVYAYLEALPEARCWLAEVDGRIVGLKMGAGKGPGVFHSHEGAVSVAFRRRGIARALLERQHAWARDQGYHLVTTNTYCSFHAMLVLNLRSGFDLVGTTLMPGWTAPKLHLAKRLDGEPGFGPETYVAP